MEVSSIVCDDEAYAGCSGRRCSEMTTACDGKGTHRLFEVFARPERYPRRINWAAQRRLGIHLVHVLSRKWSRQYVAKVALSYTMSYLTTRPRTARISEFNKTFRNLATCKLFYPRPCQIALRSVFKLWQRRWGRQYVLAGMDTIPNPGGHETCCVSPRTRLEQPLHAVDVVRLTNTGCSLEARAG